MVINNLPAYLSPTPDAFLLFSEFYLDNFFKVRSVLWAHGDESLARTSCQKQVFIARINTQYAKDIPRPYAEQSKTDTTCDVETGNNKLLVSDKLKVVNSVAITPFETHISRKYIENVSERPEIT